MYGAGLAFRAHGKEVTLMAPEIKVSDLARREALHTLLTWLRDETYTTINELRRAGNEDRASLGKAEHKIRLFDEAIEQTERGAYGFCTVCGQEISIERLASIPFTPYCVGCEEKQKQRS
jgi:RNA polymerase-binding transcription factor DksA